MSRPLRIDYPNAWHHVMNRARREQDLFVEKADYQQFIDLLQETADLFNISVAAFCLMPTHYHLMVQTPDANLSRCMRHLNGIYTQRYNVGHGCDGTLFRWRYKSILVDVDSYVLQLIRSMRSEPLMRVGADFGLNRYSSVSSVVMRVKTKLQKNRKFKYRLECIEDNILKCQT